MSTQASNYQNMPFRRGVKISDLAIIFGLMNTPVFKPLDKKNKGWHHVKTVVKQWLRFDCALLASMHWSIWSFKPGSQTIGLLSTLFASFCLIGFNHAELPIYLKPFSMFAIPIGMIRTETYQWAFYWKYDYESTFLLWYSVVFLLSSLTHIVMIWLKKGNTSLSKRGESWLVFLLSKYTRVSEYLICGIVQPLITIGLGYCLWAYNDDVYAFIFLAVTSGCEAMQQLIDRANQEHNRSILMA